MRPFRLLRTRILAASLGLLLFLGISVAVFVKTEFAAQLAAELQKRGVSIARHLAENSVEAILGDDVLTLGLLARNLKAAEADILYVFFTDTPGRRVLAHTFGDTFPVDLLAANGLAPGADASVRQLGTELGPVYDVAVPVLGGGVGQVRLGLSGQAVDGAVNRLTGQILGLTLTLLLPGALIAFLLAQAVTQPVRRLTRAAEAVAAGQLNQEVEVSGRDEVGQLAASFNHMTRHLGLARRELEQTNRELAEEVGRRRHAEGRLAAQLRFLEVLLDDIPSPVFFKDPQGVYLGCNRAFTEFMGLPKSAIVGRSIFDLIPADQARLHHEADLALFARPGMTSYEGVHTRADGGARTVLLHKATFAGEGGDVEGLVGVIQDVTREREAAQLKNEFISTAAHEFQTPLAAILGFSDLMLSSDAFGPEERREFLSLIHQKADFLSRLVDELLDLSRIEAGLGLTLHRQPCAVSEVLRTVVDTFGRRASTHRFELLLPATPPPVCADRERLIQVLENLLSNAVKYSPPGSLVRVRGEVAGDELRIEVQDEGKGMTPGEVAQVFDKFYRADTSETAPGGTGLGMFIVKSIIDAHGGRITVESAPGRGTGVVITIPVGEVEA